MAAYGRFLVGDRNLCPVLDAPDCFLMYVCVFASIKSPGFSSKIATNKQL